ncbi:hypothetical protein LT493_40495 [Streptomyces tricolor]|nr:hypothetical protein [Streptomyces tricolor]
MHRRHQDRQHFADLGREVLRRLTRRGITAERLLGGDRLVARRRGRALVVAEDRLQLVGSWGAWSAPSPGLDPAPLTRLRPGATLPGHPLAYRRRPEQHRRRPGRRRHSRGHRRHRPDPRHRRRAPADRRRAGARDHRSGGERSSAFKGRHRRRVRKLRAAGEGPGPGVEQVVIGSAPVTDLLAAHRHRHRNLRSTDVAKTRVLVVA